LFHMQSRNAGKACMRFFLPLWILAETFILLSCGNDLKYRLLNERPSLTISPSGGLVGSLATLTATHYDLSALSSVTAAGTSMLIVSRTSCTAEVLIMPGFTKSKFAAVSTDGDLTSLNEFTLTTNSLPIAHQQGAKLVGTGVIGIASQGFSVALSADGNTALVGGRGDNSGVGAGWVYVRSGATWSQQAKLVGAGPIGSSAQGTSVALSADGNTALMGGAYENGSRGAAWVFVRSGTTWSQQGIKLVGSGAVGNAMQGTSVSLSADGNTALIGGYADDSSKGAAWVFVRSGTTWSQQGLKLVDNGASGAEQGWSVALSADGNTAVLGGINDNGGIGATWIFSRSGTLWSQQAKLVSNDSVGNAGQGYGVSASADGNTVLTGAPGDNGYAGAAWVFVRSGITWSQQGSKLIGGLAAGLSNQGWSVALSADGNAMLIGGRADNSAVGASWLFMRLGTNWSQQGSKLIGSQAVGSAQQGISVALSADGNTGLIGGPVDNGNVGAAWVFVP
jgi:hypothetical protein